MRFTFNPPTSYTLTKFVLEFPLAEYEVAMWDDVALSILNPHESGAEVPCLLDYSYSLTKDHSFKCVYEKGE